MKTFKDTAVLFLCWLLLPFTILGLCAVLAVDYGRKEGKT